jgi:hypothetical protein
MVINETVKRYFLSTLITFLAGVAIAVVPELDTLSLQDVEQGALIGLLFSGVRLGVKMTLEFFLEWYAKRIV